MVQIYQTNQQKNLSNTASSFIMVKKRGDTMKQLKHFIPALIWMIIIFVESAMPATASSEQSGVIVDFINNWLPATSQYIDMITFLVRKCAHISEYIILTLLIYYALYKNNHASYLYTYLISLTYACLDEFHQLFVPGRAGMIQDVMIDSIGIILALCLIAVFLKFKAKKQLLY